MADLRVNLNGLELQNPVLLASGTCGYGAELAGLTDLKKIGGIILKTITMNPRAGNPPPRIFETPSGMLNAIGLENVGVSDLLDEKLPELRKLLNGSETKIIVNIAGESAAEYGELARILRGVKGVAAIEINASCPNLRQGGRTFGHDKTALATITKMVKLELDVPVIVKLTPNVTDIEDYARIAQSAGADILSVANTYVGMAIDIKTRKPVLSNVTGGLSGPAIRPLSLAAVWKVCNAVDIPVIGVGGIDSAEAALQFFMAGAQAAQVGTANFVEPDAARRITEGLNNYLDDNGISSIDKVVRSAVI